MKHKLLCTLLVLSGFCMSGFAERTVGDRLPSITVMDQHEKPFTLAPGIHYVLVSFDMSSGRSANRVLDDLGAEYLPGKDAVFVANIDGMPWVGRKFALPKMRKYVHRIILADEPEAPLLESFPKKDGQITVFHLDDHLKIVSVEFWDPSTGAPPIK